MWYYLFGEVNFGSINFSIGLFHIGNNSIGSIRCSKWIQANARRAVAVAVGQVAIEVDEVVRRTN